MLTGLIRTYYNNGQKYITCNYFYDKKDGEYNEYDKNGKLVRTTYYVNDVEQ